MKTNNNTFFAFVIATLSMTHVYAEPPEEGDFYAEGFLSGNTGRLSRENAFFEYALDKDRSFFVHVYTDEELTSSYAGVAHTFTQGFLENFETGIGIGQAHIESDDLLAFNPWIKYKAHGWELSSEYEYVKNGSEEYFYRTELSKEIGKHFYAGMYTGQHFGLGPLVGIRFGDERHGIKLYATKSMFNRGFAEAGSDSLVYMNFYVRL